MAGFFLEGAVTVASGSVFNDTNGDGIPDATEAGISDITISLFTDVNGNGLLDVGVDLQLGDSIDSDMTGNFVLPGVPDGNFLVVLDSKDSDIPPGLVSAPGSNPYPLAVSGADINSVNFPFVSGSGADDTVDPDDDSEAPANDDAVTAAVSDSFEVNQGSSRTYDVLENDTNGAGGVLTLRSVSESPNATILIVDNQLNYRPNFGYYSTGDTRDTFLYVMADADGNEFTGNVSVNVIRYSDLNGNMENDFTECNCTNLVLETGVHGSGIGRLSFAGSLVLLMALWIRRKGLYRTGSGVAFAEAD